MNSINCCSGWRLFFVCVSITLFNFYLFFPISSCNRCLNPHSKIDAEQTDETLDPANRVRRSSTVFDLDQISGFNLIQLWIPCWFYDVEGLIGFQGSGKINRNSHHNFHDFPFSSRFICFFCWKRISFASLSNFQVEWGNERRNKKFCFNPQLKSFHLHRRNFFQKQNSFHCLILIIVACFCFYGPVSFLDFEWNKNRTTCIETSDDKKKKIYASGVEIKLVHDFSVKAAHNSRLNHEIM